MMDWAHSVVAIELLIILLLGIVAAWLLREALATGSDLRDAEDEIRVRQKKVDALAEENGRLRHQTRGPDGRFRKAGK